MDNNDSRMSNESKPHTIKLLIIRAKILTLYIEENATELVLCVCMLQGGELKAF